MVKTRQPNRTDPAGDFGTPMLFLTHHLGFLENTRGVDKRDSANHRQCTPNIGIVLGQTSEWFFANRRKSDVKGVIPLAPLARMRVL